MRIRLSLLLACLTLLSSVALAIPPPPTSLAELSNISFGWVSLSSLDPTMGQLSAYAPNTLVLRDNNLKMGGEALYGRATYSGFNIDMEYATAVANLGPGAFRISHYRYKSNVAPLPLLNAQEGLPPDALSQAEGDSTEISYAQHIGKGSFGVSYIPQDNTTVVQMIGPNTVLVGTEQTDWGVRVGGIYPFGKTVRFGSEFSYQEGVSAATLYTPAPVSVSENYITRCLTNGVSWDARPNTMLYLYLQRLWAAGESGYKRSSNLLVGGVQQQITKDAALRVSYIDGGQSIALNLRTRIGIFNAIYDHNVLLNAVDYLGKGDAMLLSWAVAF